MLYISTDTATVGVKGIFMSYEWDWTAWEKWRTLMIIMTRDIMITITQRILLRVLTSRSNSPTSTHTTSHTLWQLTAVTLSLVQILKTTQQQVNLNEDFRWKSKSKRQDIQHFWSYIIEFSSVQARKPASTLNSQP